MKNLKNTITTIFILGIVFSGLSQNIAVKENIAFGKIVLEMQDHLPKYSLTAYKRVINQDYQYLLQVKNHDAKELDRIEKNSSILLKTGSGEILRVVTASQSTAYHVFGANEKHYEITLNVEVTESMVEKIAESGLSKIRYYQNTDKNDINILESKRDNIQRITKKLIDTELIKSDYEMDINFDE